MMGRFKYKALHLVPRAPYVYFIRKRRCLYIGETQQMPVRRWGSHFATSGSFRLALSTMDCELMESNDEVDFYAFYCQELHTFCRDVKLRRTTQFLEHLLHVETIAHPVLGTRFELISE